MHYLTREGTGAYARLFELQINQVASGLIYQLPGAGSTSTNADGRGIL
jgi:hypothetical protein